MANRLRVTELDFDTIKQNLKTFLNQQSEFTDYDFEGSGLSVLLDVLAYNTHYNAYYLNMVANESFLDTALLRDSVISHAKLLGYVPYSRKAPRANINFTVSSSSNTSATVTIPKGFRFLSNQIDGVSYGFVTLAETTVTKSNTSFIFLNLPIYEGQFVTYSSVYNQATNPKQIFTIPDDSVDTSTITVSVQPSSTNTASELYTLATSASEATTSSQVFYLQESKNGLYDVYFGNDVIGKSISDGSIVSISYLVTNGMVANKANNFVATGRLTDSLGNILSGFTINPVAEAAGGAERETVDEIKFSAPLQFTTQNRLVTYKDYESFIKKNYPAVDSVSVWGGETETPPTYGVVHIALKPKTNYYLSDTEKQRIIDMIDGFDIAQDVAAHAARAVHKKYHTYFDVADVRQELIVWILNHENKVEEFLADNEFGIKKLGKTLRRQADKYCRRAKAQAIGYHLEDEAYYPPIALATLLPYVWGDVEQVQIAQEQRVSGGSNPAEGGNMFAQLFDIRRALDKLDPQDRLLLQMKYYEELTFAEIATVLGVSDTTAHRKHDGALRRISEALGGDNPFTKKEVEEYDMD